MVISDMYVLEKQRISELLIALWQMIQMEQYSI